MLQIDDGAVTPLVTLPRDIVKDCYNLMLHLTPLCLTRQTGDTFEIVWPERVTFSIPPQETFCFRDGGRLVFERWYEDPDYRTEVVVRDLAGEILEQRPGAAQQMPDGQRWILE